MHIFCFFYLSSIDHIRGDQYSNVYNNYGYEYLNKKHFLRSIFKNFRGKFNMDVGVLREQRASVSAGITKIKLSQAIYVVTVNIKIGQTINIELHTIF